VAANELKPRADEPATPPSEIIDYLDWTPFPGSNKTRKFSLALLKFGDRCWLEKFRSGQLYLNTWKHYAELEDDPVRADRLENIDVIVQPRDLRSVRFTDPKTGQVIELREHLSGPLLINKGIRAYNVFCVFSLPTTLVGNPSVDHRNFAFGDSFTIILDSQKFLDRVQKAANAAGFALDCNLVEYYDADAHTGDVGPFRKSSIFEFQREFRVIITPGSIGSIILELGNLEDITTPIYPLAEINQLLEFTSSRG
jgi:hypothetical protein